MIIHFEGRDWHFSEDDIDLQQGVSIHLAYGFTINQWSDALEAGDIRAMQCLYWMMLAQNGIKTPLKDVNCKIVPFMTAVAEAQAAEAERQAAEESTAQPDPTSPPRSLPEGPPSPEPATPTATTRTPYGQYPAAAATGS